MLIGLTLNSSAPAPCHPTRDHFSTSLFQPPCRRTITSPHFILSPWRMGPTPDRVSCSNQIQLEPPSNKPDALIPTPIPSAPTAAAASAAFGYDAIATCINYDRDLAQFRRFGVLNARNLLYLQSELISLETHLASLDEQCNDFSKGIGVWSLPRSWHAIENEHDGDSHSDSDGKGNGKGGGEYLAVVKRIRSVLDEYSEFLSLFVHSSAPVPSREQK